MSDLPEYPNKLAVLRHLKIGNPVAEEEREPLSQYFVKTEFWRKVDEDEADIVYGAKGAGKSAIYLLLMEKQKELAKSGLILITAENARGTPAFKELVTTPPTTEENFKNLWKLYFLTLVVKELKKSGVVNAKLDEIAGRLILAGLLDLKLTRLESIVATVREYVEKISNPVTVEPSITVDPHTGATTFSKKITFREPTHSERLSDIRSIDDQIGELDGILRDSGKKVWLLLDRLDVAFFDSEELEKNAIKSLFAVYSDFRKFDRLALKIFIRTDIWERISAEGFREASHITRGVTISWDESSLKHMLMSRLVSNPSISAYYLVTREAVLINADSQEDLYNRIFPSKVEAGSKRPVSFSWLLSRITDGSGKPAPRELVAFVGYLIQKQIEQYERGENTPRDEVLFHGATFKLALPLLSTDRLTKTLYAEYPKERKWIETLKGQKAEQSIESLSQIWSCEKHESSERANRLIEIGFFEKRGAGNQLTYWVPFIYRPALELVQGLAEDALT